METIHKFVLEVMDEQKVTMPQRHTTIHVGEQQGALCVWAIVDTESPMVDVTFRVVGTGHPLPQGHDSCLLGTVVMSNSFVWHVFECVECTTDLER